MKLRELIQNTLSLLEIWCRGCQSLNMFHHFMRMWEEILDLEVRHCLEIKLYFCNVPVSDDWKMSNWLKNFSLVDGTDVDSQRDANLLAFYSNLQILLKYRPYF